MEHKTFDLKSLGLSLGVVAAVAALLLASGCKQKGDETDPHAQDLSTHSESAATLGNGVASEAALCVVHGVPEELCFICDASLRDEGRLWCQGHGRYEDRCWPCHPEARDAEREFCEEHGLYEDECFLCRPAVKRTLSAHPDDAAPDPVLMCDEHGVPEAECGICRPQVIPQLNPGEGLKVRMPSEASARGAGVETGTASVGTLSEGVECYAELAFDQNKLAQIVAPVGGVVQKVTVDLGHRVGEDETVARLWSAGIAEAIAKAVLSHQTLDRELRLREQRVTSEQDLQEAQASHRAACQQLRTFGFTEEQIHGLDEKPEESVLLDVRAPFAGEIIERLAVQGELVGTGQRLFTVGDRSVMWAMLNIPESGLARVREGQPVELQFDSLPDQTFTGTLTWISAEVDQHSRMVQARAEVPNPDGTLRARMFARARILTRSPEGALLLPTSAIQQVEGSPLVLVKLEEDLFEARSVQLGVSTGGRVEILAGLTGDEVVAVDHVFPLKSQLLISRLGAGCAHE